MSVECCVSILLLSPIAQLLCPLLCTLLSWLVSSLTIIQPLILRQFCDFVVPWLTANDWAVVLRQACSKALLGLRWFDVIS